MKIIEHHTGKWGDEVALRPDGVEVSTSWVLAPDSKEEEGMGNTESNPWERH